MKIRKQIYGDKNIVGKNIERIRKERGIKQKDFIAKMQIMGYDINPTSYSKLEGQLRSATDEEIFIIAKILEITLEELMLEEDFNTGMSLSDIERQKFLKEIESLKSENSILKQRILILTEKYDGYVKKAK